MYTRYAHILLPDMTYMVSTSASVVKNLNPWGTIKVSLRQTQWDNWSLKRYEYRIPDNNIRFLWTLSVQWACIKFWLEYTILMQYACTSYETITCVVCMWTWSQLELCLPADIHVHDCTDEDYPQRFLDTHAMFHRLAVITPIKKSDSPTYLLIYTTHGCTTIYCSY